MAKAKKAAKRKPASKAAKKKTIAKRKPAASSRGKSKKTKAKAPSRRAAAPQGVQLGVSVELDDRLRALATQMNKSLEEILIQALTEFADNWEDHIRTIRNLSAGDDRMQLSVRDDDNTV